MVLAPETRHRLVIDGIPASLRKFCSSSRLFFDDSTLTIRQTLWITSAINAASLKKTVEIPPVRKVSKHVSCGILDRFHTLLLWSDSRTGAVMA